MCNLWKGVSCLESSLLFYRFREDIGPQIPGQQIQQPPIQNAYAHGMPAPSAYSAPQYYTPEQQAFSQPPNMYMPNPMGMAPPMTGTPPIPAPITPAVRKMDEPVGDATTAEKKPRLDAEPEWQTPQVVSIFVKNIKWHLYN